MRINSNSKIDSSISYEKKIIDDMLRTKFWTKMFFEQIYDDYVTILRQIIKII